MKEERSLKATIATRNCPTCGHHEVGYVTEDGGFHALKPGDTVRLAAKDGGASTPEDPSAAVRGTPPQEETLAEEILPWIPDPLRHDRALRMKFGVFIGRRMLQAGMSGSIYELAFQQKLQDLIEKEIYVPLPVILDRYFNSPHLAAGTAKEVADALFQELDEISGPVERMRAWLENPNPDNLERLMHPKTPGGSPAGAPGDAALKQELASLTLEEFFDLL